SETGFAAPELAAARTLGFSCFGFFTSLFPRLLSPFPITSSLVDYPARRHAGRTDPRISWCLIRVRAMILVSCIRPPSEVGRALMKYAPARRPARRGNQRPARAR